MYLPGWVQSFMLLLLPDDLVLTSPLPLSNEAELTLPCGLGGAPLSLA